MSEPDDTLDGSDCDFCSTGSSNGKQLFAFSLLLFAFLLLLFAFSLLLFAFLLLYLRSYYYITINYDNNSRPSTSRSSDYDMIK